MGQNVNENKAMTKVVIANINNCQHEITHAVKEQRQT